MYGLFLMFGKQKKKNNNQNPKQPPSVGVQMWVRTVALYFRASVDQVLAVSHFAACSFSLDS